MERHSTLNQLPLSGHGGARSRSFNFEPAVHLSLNFLDPDEEYAVRLRVSDLVRAAGRPARHRLTVLAQQSRQQY